MHLQLVALHKPRTVCAEKEMQKACLGVDVVKHCSVTPGESLRVCDAPGAYLWEERCMRAAAGVCTHTQLCIQNNGTRAQSASETAD